ncbi:nuclear pore complex protein Nup160-like [Amphiura filiformis]|uniref:nuclear pore complex protein Nup160-like n=1 Tax=Amphiura filiformis TaxID=82378 RepID=UPI003B21A904
MADYSSYHEASLVTAENYRWKELTITTGATQGTLQDVNLPDSAGGFSYRDSAKVNAVTRNRFIYWRSSQDTVELVELSLDYNLSGNAVRLRFPDAPILPRVSIHETHSHVVVLVATIHSVHRLVVPHPNKLHRMEPYGGESSVPSVFADVSLAQFRESTNCYVISHSASQSYEFHTSASWLTNEGEALFAMATNVGSVVLIKLAPMGIQGIVTQHELRQATVMQRLWTGLVPAVMRRGQETIDTTLSLVMNPVGQDFFVFCVCRDHKLRMWSCKNQTCLASIELLEFLPDGAELSEAPAVGHKIRQAVGSDPRNLIIGVYLGFPDRNQFLVLQPTLEDGQWRLLHIASIEGGKESTLIDFGLTMTHLWAAWSTSSGETVAKFKAYEGGGPGSEGWSPVFLSSSHSSDDLLVPPFLEPREAYMDHIFQPGKFSLHSIGRALNLYHGQSGGEGIGSLSDMSQISMDALKEETMAIIGNDIQQKVGGSEMTQEEYHNLLQQSWSKFYACCVQYHEVANKAVGVMLDQATGMVVIVKKSLLSVLRPCDAVEHLYLSPIGSCVAEDFANVPFVTDETSLCNDLIALSDCIKIVRGKLSPIIQLSFENDLFQLVRPEEVAHQIASDLLGLGADTDTPSREAQGTVFTAKLSRRLQAIQDMDKTIQTMLAAIDLAEGNPESLMLDEDEPDAQQHLNASGLFTSSSAVDLLATSFTQMSHTRLNLLRDLLILQCAMLRLGQQASISQDISIKIQSELIPDTANLLLAYYMLYYMSGCVTTSVHTNSMESNMRQLAALEITDASSGLGQSLAASQMGGMSPTVIHMFLRGVGGTQVRSQISRGGYLSQDMCEMWTGVLLPAVSKLAQLIWPISANFLFSEFLMCRCQYTQLQECIRLLNPWCEWNAGSRQFLLGHSLLNSGEPHKALSCFLKVANRLAREDFLLNKLLQTEELEGKKLDILYYLKVIRLLEQFSVPDLVISLANTALSVADDDDPNISTLWCKVFKYHLELGHIDEAYRAMTANRDHERRHDCLRQFVVVLCERAQIKQLCQFPYVDLHDEVVSIIESRARTVDLTTHNYYDLLYAFHIYRGNYRKAGGVMYEQAMRLALEVPTLSGLQQQAKCYLAAINALRLVHPNYAWIVKPVPTDTQPSREDMMGASPKRTYDGDELEQHVKRQVTVLELKEIEKEYLLVSARLKLANHEQDSSHVTGISLSADETLALLVQAGLFDTAVTVCKTFKLPLNSVFEGLATKCVKLSSNGPDDLTWKWLSANELGQLNPSRDVGPADIAWRLLRAYLIKYDQEGDHTYYKCVVNRLLSVGFHLPKWLVNTYKKLHAAELLTLYINYDMLEEATYLALEYIDAVMGKGTEYFGLTTPLRATAPSVWLPYNAIDHLSRALRDATNEPLLQKLHLSLQNKLRSYHNQAQQVSEQMTNLALQRYQQGTS